MAFSTQKEFFHVPFMNETVDYECRRACVQLKSYDSTIDDRAWALDETNRSRFLTDLVTCKTPVSNYDDGDGVSSPAQRKRGERGRRVPSDSRGVNPADSLIAATNVTLDKVQNLLQDKRNLQQKLNKSEENLKTAKAEYDKIREILNRKFDRSEFKDIYNRIQKMAASGNFTKNDENDFLQFFKKMEDLGKAYEVSQAENSYLKRLLEKLSRRAEMEKIPLEPETSKDIPYLQDQVNKLRKELMALRKLEDNKMNIDESGTDVNVDANNLNIIIRERNALRERLCTMQDIERQVAELRKRLCDASEVSNNLSNSLDNKSKYIGDLENDMREMQSHYEKREEERNCKLDCFRRKFEELKRELCAAKLEAQKVQCLKSCIARLEESIKLKDRKLCDYDSQFKQLMCVINELRNGGTGSGGIAGPGSPSSGSYGGVTSRNGRQDCTTQTAACATHVDELAYYTSATLNEIKKELRKRGITGDECGSSVKPEDCCKEVERLRKIISELQGDKTRLSLSLMERNKCLDGLTSRLDDLCNEFDKNAEESEGARENLNNALNLVGDISQMQEKNQKLMGIADKLSKKEIDDLINDLQKRLKSCLEEKEDYKMILNRKGFDVEQELKGLEDSRKRGSAPPRQPPDMGPLVGKLVAVGAEEPKKQAPEKPVLVDPATGKPISGEGSTVIDPVTGKSMLVDPVTGKPVTDPATGKPILIDPGTGKPITGGAPGGATTTGGPSSTTIDPVTGKPILADPVTGKPVIDPSTGKPIFVDPATGKPTTDGAPGGATATGGPSSTTIDPVTGKPILADPVTGKPVIDPKTGKPIVVDPATGKPLTDGAPGGATATGGPSATTIDPVSGKPVLADPATGKPVIDPTTGKPIVVDPATGKPLTDGAPGGVAATGGPVSTTIDPVSGKPILTDPATGKPVIDPKTGKTIEVDPATGKPLTEGAPGGVAVKGGPGSTTIDPVSGKPILTDPETGKPVIDPKTGKTIEVDPATGKPLADGVPGGTATSGGPGSTAIDPATGKPILVDPATGKPVIDPATGKTIIVDPVTGKPTTDGAPRSPGSVAIDPGTGKPVLIDKVTGKPVIDPKTGKPIFVDPVTGKPDRTHGAGRPSVGRPSQAGGPSGHGTPTGRPATSAGAIVTQITGGGKPRGPRGSRASRGSRGSTETMDQYTDFVSRNADNMAMNLQAGNSLHKELRKILDAFVDECRYCLCQSKVPKSKFYAICHKILHEGIMNLSFKEIAYIHKKIYYAAEKLYPGCLLNVILTEYADIAQEQKKCCKCKSVLCCDSSQEMLKEKVRKLEVEVELAKDYLDSIRARSRSRRISQPDDNDDTDDRSSTFRQKKSRSSPKYTTRQIKHIKACFTKCSQNMKS